MNKFYMNNPCKIIREVNEDFVEVEIYPLTEDSTQSGGFYCTPCMVGGTSCHSCGEYQEVIDNINAEREDKCIISIVEKRLLQDEIVELKQYKKLHDQVVEKHKEYGEIRNKIYDGNQSLKGLQSAILYHEATIDNLIEDINKAWKDLDEVQEARRLCHVEVNSLKSTKTKVILEDKFSVNISLDELKGLFEAKHRLDALEQGGVDNWEWYGESLEQYGS